MNFGKSVEFEVLSTNDAPGFIQTVIQDNNRVGFSLFQDETSTYIYYASDHVPNEYITTDLNVKIKGGKYIATATVKSATNIPNGDQLIKLNKNVEKDISLRAKIK